MGQTKKLKKQLGLLDVYAISTGATLSAGFFLLPGIAAETAGSALVLAYMIAALPMVPAMFSVVELSTAMPRAGGVYYFLDRSLGPLIGMIGGLGTWLALILKVSFALVGMGAYLGIFFPEVRIIPTAVVLAVALGAINAYGASKSGRLQVFLVGNLLVALAIFIFGSLPELTLEPFRGMLEIESSSILATAGFVYISYVGVTKVASLSEEVRDPERVLPRAVFLSLGTAFIVYTLGTTVMVGVVPMPVLAGNLTPAATAAATVFGNPGRYMLAFAALVAFTSVANAGTLSASRYPLAMSRDHLMPRRISHLSASGSPLLSIAVTVSLIVAVLITLDVAKIAKLASAFQLLIFALVSVAVIVWRESGIESYDPGHPSPLYPWMQLFGIFSSLLLIGEMGWLPSLFSAGLVAASIVWFRLYASDRVNREGAIYHLFERLGRRRYHGLDLEMRGILKEKGLRDHDPFDEIVARSSVIDLDREISFEDLVDKAATLLAAQTEHDAEFLAEGLLQGTRVGATPVAKSVALPHIRIADLAHAEMVIVRSLPGVDIIPDLPGKEPNPDGQRAHAIFFLVSPKEDPAQHLRILAQLADHVDQDHFQTQWTQARNDHDLKEVLLRDDNFLSLTLEREQPAGQLIGRAVREIDLPEDALVAIVRRHGEPLVPKGATVLEKGDRVTIIGTRGAITGLEQTYHPDERSTALGPLRSSKQPVK
ncbi:MAG: amino acid permease [Acidobacteriota bacterium]